MNSEEMERAIQFILQQQAQFWASVQSLEGIVRDHTAQIGQLTSRVDQLTSRVDQLTGHVGQLAGHVGNLTDLVMRLGSIVEEQGRRSDERLDLLAESQRRTDERLNTLINVVERYFSNGRKQ